MAVLNVLCYLGVRWMRIWVSETLPRVRCPQPSSIVMPCAVFGSISQHPSLWLFSLWLLQKHCVILSQAEDYSFIFPSAFFLKVSGRLLLLFVFYSVLMMDLFPKLQSYSSFLHRQMSWSPSSPGSQGLCRQLATGLLFWAPCCPLGRISGCQVSWASVQGIQSLALCVWSIFILPVHSGGCWNWFSYQNFEYVCLLSVNFQCPIGKSVVIFCNLLVLFLPARSPSESSLCPLRPETSWGALVGLCMYGAGCLVAACDLDAL